MAKHGLFGPPFLTPKFPPKVHVGHFCTLSQEVRHKKSWEGVGDPNERPRVEAKKFVLMKFSVLSFPYTNLRDKLQGGDVVAPPTTCCFLSASGVRCLLSVIFHPWSIVCQVVRQSVHQAVLRPSIRAVVHPSVHPCTSPSLTLSYRPSNQLSHRQTD